MPDENTEPHVPPPAIPYAVGDRVIATQDIWEEADEHSPASMYAAKGDILIVRAVELMYAVNVSHEHRLDNSFGVELHEIQIAPPCESSNPKDETMSNQETDRESPAVVDRPLSPFLQKLQGVRWKIVGSGSEWPEGITAAYFEWENGAEASFASCEIDLEKLANEWMEAHEDEEWCSDPLPTWLTEGEWVGSDED